MMNAILKLIMKIKLTVLPPYHLALETDGLTETTENNVKRINKQPGKRLTGFGGSLTDEEALERL